MGPGDNESSPGPFPFAGAVVADLVVTNDGELYLLDRAIRTPWDASEVWSLRLYDNDFTPCKDMVISDITEATFSGYAAIDLVRADWTDPVSVSGVATSWNGSGPKEFDALSGVVTIYGYYVTVPGADDLFLLAQRFDSPVLLTASAPLLFTPQLTLHSESQPDCPPPPPPP